MTERILTYLVTYPDRPCDLVYDIKEAARLLGQAPPGSKVLSRTIVRYDDGRRDYLSS